MNREVFIVPKREVNYGEIGQNIAQPFAQQQNVYQALIPLLFKAQMEKQSKLEELALRMNLGAKIRKELHEGGNGPDGEYTMELDEWGLPKSYKQKSPKEKQESEVIGREPNLANVLSYIRKSIPSGASPEGILGMVRPERFPSGGEQTQISNTLKTAMGLRPKSSQAKEKRIIEVGELGNQAQDLISLFRQGQEEGKKVGGFGEVGVGGRIAGRKASILGALGVGGYPSLNIYNRKKKAFATVVAKAAGEVRPTDEDIKRFLGTLPDFNLSDEENDIVINQLMADIQSKGYKKVWSERKTGKAGIPTGYKMQKNKRTGATRLVPIGG